MSRLWTSLWIAASCLSGAWALDQKTAETYVKKHLVKNPQVKVKGVEISEKRKIKNHPDWEAVFLIMTIEFQGKDAKIPEVLFVNNRLATSQLIDLKTGENYRTSLRPSVPESVYDDARLLYGNKDAKHKVVVFSDPMCPFCRETVPAIIEAAKKHPDKIALYYYHLPLLRIHPVSGPLTKIMHTAQHEGKKEVIEKIYTINLPFKETNLTKIIQAVHKHTGYSVSESKINDPKVQKAIDHDADVAARLMVNGTPTVFIDGKLDKTRKGYEALVK